ncbi:hypothetical protein WJX81_000291 [Elliptochloris bilobata]|uniref:Uncharacterized protein n=1 Tax=Elliptochloris bilobata TaxID=381761 RepID=A0AAW1QWG2_9CHLO
MVQYADIRRTIRQEVCSFVERSDTFQKAFSHKALDTQQQDLTQQRNELQIKLEEAKALLSAKHMEAQDVRTRLQDLAKGKDALCQALGELEAGEASDAARDAAARRARTAAAAELQALDDTAAELQACLEAHERERGHTKRSRDAALADVARLEAEHAQLQRILPPAAPACVISTTTITRTVTPEGKGWGRQESLTIHEMRSLPVSTNIQRRLADASRRSGLRINAPQPVDEEDCMAAAEDELSPPSSPMEEDTPLADIWTDRRAWG